VGKITKKQSEGVHSKYSAKIHSYRLLFRRFCPLANPLGLSTTVTYITHYIKYNMNTHIEQGCLMRYVFVISQIMKIEVNLVTHHI